MDVGARLQWGSITENLNNWLNTYMFTRWEQLSSQRQFCSITYKTRWGMNECASSSGSRVWLGYGMLMTLHGKPKAVSTPKRDFCAHSLIVHSTLGWMEVQVSTVRSWAFVVSQCFQPWAGVLNQCFFAGLVQYSWVKNRLCNCVDNQTPKLWGTSK